MRLGPPAFAAGRASGGSLRQSHGPGWALVGDSAYFKDPVSAHGITDALIGAELLADALIATGHGTDEHEALAGYQRERNQLAAALMPPVAAAGELRGRRGRRRAVLPRHERRHAATSFGTSSAETPRSPPPEHPLPAGPGPWRGIASPDSQEGVPGAPLSIQLATLSTGAARVPGRVGRSRRG